MKLLHVDSSIQGESSVSRQLTAAIRARLLQGNPDASVTYRDLAVQPLPQYNSEAVAANRTPAGAPPGADSHALGLLQVALDEVLAADVVIVGAPMYNFGVPAQLKAWVDSICVPGKTFRYSEKGPEGLLGDKRIIIGSSRGGVYAKDSPMAALEHQETYLRAVFSFLGVKRIEVVRAEGLLISPQSREQSMRDALASAANLELA
jgi:FMN-dependent NADH-azoreductase